MTGAWGLPMQAELGGVRYAIRSDYRDVLELLRWLNGQADPALDQSERWYVAMRLFYPEFAALPQPLWPDATQFLTEFLAAGRREQPRPGPALMDWQQDAPLIAAGISKAAGQDVRTLPYLHWWSFLAWFDAIGEGSFATVVAIRDKLRRGKRLENWELDYYRTHRAVVELRGCGTDTRVRQLGFITLPFSDEARQKILQVAGGAPLDSREICLLNFYLGDLSADACLEACRAAGIQPGDVDFVGSHGAG